MRLLIALGLFMASLVLLLVGVAQRTIWAPPSEYRMAVEFDAANPFLVVPNETLSAHPGVPIITTSGSKNLFIATGRESDILAWVGNTSYTLIAADQEGEKLVVTSVNGPGPKASPVGADLWRTEVSAESVALLKAPTLDSGAAIIATDGNKPAPGRVELVWPIKFDLFGSDLLIWIGSGLLALALILNFISYRTLRKRRGPSRRVPKAPQGPKLRLSKPPRMAPPRGRRSARGKLAAPAALVTLALLTGCSPAEPNAEPTPTPTAVAGDPPVVQQAQLARILSEVASAAKAGDAKNDRTKLVTRFQGPALEQRIAYYSLRKLDANLPKLPTIAGKPITFTLPAATTLWPRTVMAVTDEDGDANPQMLVLQQANPRAQYQLWYNIRLMPGAMIPSVPVPEIGAIPVAPDAKFLTVVPKLLPKVYGTVIDNGAGSPNADLFDLSADEFFKQISESQDAQVAALKNGKITFSHTLGNANVLALATTEGGALVAVSMVDGYTIRPTKAGSAITVTGLEKTMLGASGSPTGIVSRYSDMLLFYIPASGSEARAKILGVTQGLLSVRSR